MTEPDRPLEAASDPVLVVDDEDAVRSLFARALRDAGYDTREAADGVEALDLLERERVALIVLDSTMPRLDGAGVVRAVRERAATRTLPVILITGSGDENSVITGLEAGADDFLEKPARLDEVVARVRAHLRSRTTWLSVVEEELQGRSAVVEALSHLALPLATPPEEAAEAIVAELSRRTACDFIAVWQLIRGDHLLELATYTRIDGMRRGGTPVETGLSRDLVARARQGPWVEDVVPSEGDVRAAAFVAANVTIGAGAPIHAGDELVGLLWLGVGQEAQRPAPVRRAGLLASAIDYASILGATVGSALADRRGRAAIRAELQGALAARAFHPVFQPMVDLGSRHIVGYEALTRFADGTRPDLRFAQAAAVGLGPDYELAAIEAALAAASRLPSDAFLSLNASPGLVLGSTRRLRESIRSTTRQLIIELTEHVPIDDYAAVREAIAELGGVGLAVDDAGAGYASLRHILELGPTFVKLDVSLVRAIEGDGLRQALAAGLDYFALRSGFHLIAEGVETEDEAATLEGLGIEFGQGYLFGRPEPVGD